MIILVDPVYNPNLQSSINSSTRLSPGVTIAKFLGAYGDRTSFDHIGSNAERSQIARNLYMQGEAIRTINGNTIHFNDIRLVVSEGLYRAGPSETLSADTTKKADGRLCYYQVIDREGNINFEKTFDVAEYWKDNIDYKTLTLDYDTYNPDGTLTAQIGLEFPTIPESFDVSFSNSLQTMFNNQTQSKNELVEILPN
jgi:hypothetical protein